MKSFYSNRSKLVFLLPGFILFTLFVIYSIIPCFIMSLQNHNGAASLGWVGFDNYITTLKSPAFWEAHKNTYLIVALELIIGIPGSLLQALEMGQVLCDEAAYAIIRKLDLGAETEGKQAVVVFNPQPFEVEEVCKVMVTTPRGEDVWSLSAHDVHGNELKVQEISRDEKDFPVHDLEARPWPFAADRHLMYLETGKIPAMGYKMILLEPK